MLNSPDEHQEIRDAVRDLCRQFPDEYFRRIDEQRAYPEASSMRCSAPAGWRR
jgi:acyl-CoA dehydrogenase